MNTMCNGAQISKCYDEKSVIRYEGLDQLPFFISVITRRRYKKETPDPKTSDSGKITHTPNKPKKRGKIANGRSINRPNRMNERTRPSRARPSPSSAKPVTIDSPITGMPM